MDGMYHIIIYPSWIKLNSSFDMYNKKQNKLFEYKIAYFRDGKLIQFYQTKSLKNLKNIKS